MERALRRRFILTAMLAFSLVIVVLYVSLNLFNYYRQSERQSATLQYLSVYGLNRAPKEGAGTRVQDADAPAVEDADDGDADDDAEDEAERRGPRAFDGPEARFTTRYFSIMLDANGRIIQTDTAHISALSAAGAENLAARLWTRVGDGSEGTIDNYRYLVKAESGGLKIYFLDIFREQRELRESLMNGLAIVCAFEVLVLALLTLLSKYAIRPYVEAHRRQKEAIAKQARFVSDASHELKTPLAVISANNDLLELELGPNEWLESNAKQVERLSGLIEQLLRLARLDEKRGENGAARPGERVLLKPLAEKLLEDFRSRFQARSLGAELRLEAGDALAGDAGKLEELLRILLDNAAKYGLEGGAVCLGFDRAAGTFYLENESRALDEADLAKVFDRFFRADPARSRAIAGNGMGLSIARALAEDMGLALRAAQRFEGARCFFRMSLGPAS